MSELNKNNVVNLRPKFKGDKRYMTTVGFKDLNMPEIVVNLPQGDDGAVGDVFTGITERLHDLASMLLNDKDILSLPDNQDVEAYVLRSGREELAFMARRVANNEGKLSDFVKVVFFDSKNETAMQEIANKYPVHRYQ